MSTKKKRKARKIFPLEQSPFYPETLKSRTKEKLSDIKYDNEKDVFIGRKVLYKSDEYVKVMIPKELNITEFHRLSKLATTILYYIITVKLEYNSPVFVLKTEEIIKMIGISSENKIYEAIKELCNGDHIARTNTKQVYWVNHNKYYKGTYITIKEIIQ